MDIVERSESGPVLTGFTLADLQAGQHGSIDRRYVRGLLRNAELPALRRWRSRVGQRLEEFSTQRFVRNRPEPFLPRDGTSPLGIPGLHCALATWLEAHGEEKASPEQWHNRISNLNKKGLREEEVELSCLLDSLRKQQDCGDRAAVTGDEIASTLNYSALRLSVLPVIHPTDNQLKFESVPSNAEVKRIKPKLRAGELSKPQLRDRVLGYWVDAFDWDDLLDTGRRWMAFTHRGEPVVPHGKPSGLCANYEEAVKLANNHAQKIFPKLSAKGKWSHFRLTGGEQYREWVVTLPYYPDSFFSDHFHCRNLLLHVRCDIRTGVTGERVLLLQEVQSDWAQEARRFLQGRELSEPVAVPPWLKEWPALALKLMLLHAAQQGVTALAWAHGTVQVERYKGAGGEAGLLRLYDYTLPAEAIRIMRSYGRRCESIEVYQPVNYYIEPAETGYEVRDEDRKLLGAVANWEDAKQLLPDGARHELKAMHGVKLDETLRQAVLANGFYAWGQGIG